MTSNEIRKQFLDFFRTKQHHIVGSAPMVIKNDPTLMFTNAGMNQFKDLFLGNSAIQYPRIADTQKCLRVSGKHNDLEEVGHDTYHHTMFEMLGNWSFGDYFKKEAIAWAWEFLTEVLKIDKDILYVTVFEGDEKEGIPMDKEAYDYWAGILPARRILLGSKKDNFWEMGDTGPCGPCSEIHVDLRSEAEKAVTPGQELVNKGDTLVIEVWNLVFIEFNRQANGKLVNLPAKHVDTGMGFERLSMVVQGVKSNYDTDIFQPIIQHIAAKAGIQYGVSHEADIAMRVVADHLRAVSFAIADGQLPSNAKAGYVIRRILRRAVRYGYSFLSFREAFIYELLPVLVGQMGETFPELKSQQDFVSRVIAEEEASFLRTLSTGIQKFEVWCNTHPEQKVIDGHFAFELFDTYGFPVDLTQLMARELGREVDMEGFNAGMDEQKNRSRQAASVDTADWIELQGAEEGKETFVGWEQIENEVHILRYRKIRTKEKEFYQLVFDSTPFYAEAGGQVGDTGYILKGDLRIAILDTKKENNLIVHIAEKLPEDMGGSFMAYVDRDKRDNTARNHSATHLLHKALRETLGTHVEQKGSLVDADHLRFDFSHFQKLTDEELHTIETKVNKWIRENLHQEVRSGIPMEEAVKMGAMALFGEKYGDRVRVVKFGHSLELCGGTHVKATGEIGLFRIVSESAIAAGIRRIEAITGEKAMLYFDEQIAIVEEVRRILKGTKDIGRSLSSLVEENSLLRKQMEAMQREKASGLKNELLGKLQEVNGINFLATRVELPSSAIKDLAFDLKDSANNLFLVLANVQDSKPGLTVVLSENLVREKGLDASKIVRELAKEIQGGGGGQSFYATAGGKLVDGLDKALEMAGALARGIR